MADVRIDTSSLTYKNFLILGQTATPVDGSTGAVLSLSPGTYTFQQPDIDADFLFEVTLEGFVNYTPAQDSFLSGRGTSTLVVRGLSITLDATLLSHNLLPTVRESSSLLRDRTHEMHLLPASSYGFYVERGILADFLFGVDVNGQVIVDSRFAGFAQADGRTLRIFGYRLTLDGRALSHDLKPIVIESFLPRDRTHELTLIPAFAYTFQPAPGIVADFFFDVDVNGQIVIDPLYRGFATVNERSLTISGYQITIDGQQLSHDLAVSIYAANQDILSRDRTHELMLIPAVGYGFVSAAGIGADFQFALNVNGQVIVDPRYGGFAGASGRSLTISGYKVTIDGRELPYDLMPSLLGNQNVLSRDRVNELMLIPASAYVLTASENPEIQFRITLDASGGITILGLPDGLVVEGRFCGVPDPGGVIDPLTFGSPGGGRWDRSALRVSINTAGCNFNAPGAAQTPQGLITDAFRRWQIASAFFTFNIVPANTPADIRVIFGDDNVDSRFGVSGGTIASAGYPGTSEQGKIQFDSAETWSDGSVAGTSNLLAVAVHEIGHALGLSHSNRPNGTMYPYQTPAVVVDAESQNALRLMYSWEPQQHLSDRGTSDRATLGVRGSSNFTSRVEIPRMVWKGARDNSGIYESELLSDGWTPQRRIPEIGSSHSPSLVTISAPGPTLSTGLLMAWKGIPGDQGLYWSRDLGMDWESQQRIPGVGSSTRPALAMVAGQVRMAWKGIDGDSGIYWSTFDGIDAWSAQSRVNGVGTSDSPAIVGINNRLYMFWKGIEDDSTAYWSILDFANDPIWRPQRRIEYFSYETGGGIPLAIGTTGGLTATQRGNAILIAWKGVQGDSGIYVSLFADDEFGGQIRVPNVGTSVGPSVVNVDGRTLMAWKGIDGDSTIYWSRL